MRASRRRFAVGTLALVAVVLASGCQKPGDGKAKLDEAVGPGAPALPAAPPPASPSAAAREGEAIALMQQMGDIFSRNLRDCDKLASELASFIAEHRAALGAMTAMLNKLSDPEQSAFEQRNKAAQEEIGKKMQAGVVACSQNPNVQAALRNLPSE